MRRTSSLTAIVVAMAVGVTAAWAQGAVRYVGKKHGKVVVSLRVAPASAMVTRMTIRYRVTCDNGGSATRSTQLTNLRINHSGHVAFHGSYKGTQDGSTNHVTLRGTVTRKRAVGTFKLKAVGVDAASGGRVRCHSATVRWRAKRVR